MGGRKRSGSMFTNGVQSALRVMVDVTCCWLFLDAPPLFWGEDLTGDF